MVDVEELTASSGQNFDSMGQAIPYKMEDSSNMMENNAGTMTQLCWTPVSILKDSVLSLLPLNTVADILS